MIRWTGLAPWQFKFRSPGSLTSTFLEFLYYNSQRYLLFKGFPGRSLVSPLLSEEPQAQGPFMPCHESEEEEEGERTTFFSKDSQLKIKARIWA